jgi:tRNA 2-thiouridine synthesizing protein C
VKQFTAAYRALGDFGIHRVYVERESLQARGMDEGDLMAIRADADGPARNLVEVVSSGRMSDLIASQHILLNQ